MYDQDESGWWTGEIGDQYGLFPGAFVEFIDGPTDENYDFLKSTGDEEEQRTLQAIAKPAAVERTTSADRAITPSTSANNHNSSAENDALKRKLAEAEEARAILQAQVDQLTKAAAVSAQAQSSDELARRAKAQEEEIAILHVEKQRLEQSAIADAAELNSLRKTRAELEGTVHILRQTADTAQAEASKARSERDALQEQLRQADSSRQAASDSQSSAASELQAQKAVNAHLTQEIAQLKAKLATPTTSSNDSPSRSFIDQKLEVQVRDLKAALEKEQAERIRLSELLKNESRAAVRAAAEKRPPPSSPKPVHMNSSPVVGRPAAGSMSAPSPERPSIPPRRSIITQPVNPDVPPEPVEAWKDKKLKPTGLLAQLP